MGILDKLKAVDGSGSGLDADLLDGLHASSFLRTERLARHNIVGTNGDTFAKIVPTVEGNFGLCSFYGGVTDNPFSFATGMCIVSHDNNVTTGYFLIGMSTSGSMETKLVRF